MLVLSRKAGEKIQIGNDIEVVVVHISPNRVRLGFNCPTRTMVHREEVYRRICLFQDAQVDTRIGELVFQI